MRLRISALRPNTEHEHQSTCGDEKQGRTQTPATRRCSWRKLRQMNRRRCQMSWPCVEVAFILTPEPEPEHLNSARTSLVFEPQYLDRLDARRADEEFVGLCH